MSVIVPRRSFICFFFNDTATTEIYTLSLHDALPISEGDEDGLSGWVMGGACGGRPWHQGCRANASRIVALYVRVMVSCASLDGYGLSLFAPRRRISPGGARLAEG